MKRTVLIAAILSGGRAAPAALAGEDDCNVPMAQWQPREAVEQMAKAQGWTVRRIKVDDGCYQIRGIDETGRPFKAKIDPATLTIVKMKHRSRSGRHRHERAPSAPTETAEPSGPVSPKSLFDRGEPPKATVN